ncbi:MAG TPA: rhodanese-like domain-containing protein [Saprospiraceae bacterium]|nr:rhodanese-like domain-containing protein [Saprospiraceae bacterium]
MDKTLILILLIPMNIFSQMEGISLDFKKTIDRYLSGNVQYIYVEELKLLTKSSEELIILDAREEKEYAISHIENALLIGYNPWDKNLMNSLEKNKTIVIYCSIGYRSEKIGEKLLKAGFTDVRNLYGSIFAWVNAGNPVYDQHGQITPFIHGYNKSWSKWISNPKYQKIW